MKGGRIIYQFRGGLARMEMRLEIVLVVLVIALVIVWGLWYWLSGVRRRGYESGEVEVEREFEKFERQGIDRGGMLASDTLEWEREEKGVR